MIFQGPLHFLSVLIQTLRTFRLAKNLENLGGLEAKKLRFLEELRGSRTRTPLGALLGVLGGSPLHCIIQFSLLLKRIYTSIIINKILHTPVTKLRAPQSRNDRRDALDVIEKLFNLDVSSSLNKPKKS